MNSSEVLSVVSLSKRAKDNARSSLQKHTHPAYLFQYDPALYSDGTLACAIFLEYSNYVSKQDMCHNTKVKINAALLGNQERVKELRSLAR